jgi:hypothetical protein
MKTILWLIGLPFTMVAGVLFMLALPFALIAKMLGNNTIKISK